MEICYCCKFGGFLIMYNPPYHYKTAAAYNKFYCTRYKQEPDIIHPNNRTNVKVTTFCTS